MATTTAAIVAGLALSATAQQPFAFDDQDPRPRHLQLAEYVVDNVRPENNEFAINPTFLKVPGLHDVDQIMNRNMCASLQTHLIKLSYGATDEEYREWSGYNSPFAATYHGLIEAENGFIRLHNIHDIRPGDYTFWKYGDGDGAPTASGHSMMISTTPEEAFSSMCDRGQKAWRFGTIEASWGGVSRQVRYTCASADGEIVRDGPMYGRLTKFHAE